MIPSRLALAVLLPLFASACVGGLGQDGTRPVTSHPADDGTMRLADATRQGGDLSAAAKLYGEILKRQPDNEAARMGLGDVQLQAGEVERARLTYGEAARRNPKSAAPLLGLARISVNKRELGEAERRFNQAQPLLPATDVRVLDGLGVVRDMQGRHAEAQEHYRQALAMQPDNAGVRSNLGLSLALSGNPRQAINVLLDIATTPSAPPQARQNLALAYGLMGNGEAAETVLANELERPAVQNNLRYYDYLRGRGFAQPAPGRNTP